MYLIQKIKQLNSYKNCFAPYTLLQNDGLDSKLIMHLR